MGVGLGAVVLQRCGTWQARRCLTWVGVDGSVADCVAVAATEPLTDPLGDDTALTEDDEDGEVDRDAASVPLAESEAVPLPDALADTVPLPVPLRDSEPLPLGDPLCEGVDESEAVALPLPLPDALPLAVALTLPLLLAVPVTLPVCDGVAD
jgi:hypothetical protein